MAQAKIEAVQAEEQAKTEAFRVQAQAKIDAFQLDVNAKIEKQSTMIVNLEAECCRLKKQSDVKIGPTSGLPAFTDPSAVGGGFAFGVVGPTTPINLGAFAKGVVQPTTSVNGVAKPTIRTTANANQNTPEIRERWRHSVSSSLPSMTTI